MGNTNSGAKPVKYKRERPPAHFSLSIQSFSLLSDSNVEKYESGIFEVAGYKWSLSLYPNGDRKNRGKGHISLYLAIEDTGSLRHGWTVDVNYKLFVQDQTTKKYLTIQDAEGVVSRFHALKTQFGFPRLLSLEKFKEPSNGYLVGDTCLFGAEIFVIYSTTMRQEILTMTRGPPSDTHPLQFHNFLKLNKDFQYSESFTIGRNKWKIKVFPRGCSDQYDRSLSVFLELCGAAGLPSKRKIYAKYILRVLDQQNSNHKQNQGEHWFSASDPISGFSSFLPSKDVRKFVHRDTLTVEVEILVSSTVSVN